MTVETRKVFQSTMANNSPSLMRSIGTFTTWNNCYVTKEPYPDIQVQILNVKDRKFWKHQRKRPFYKGSRKSQLTSQQNQCIHNRIYSVLEKNKTKQTANQNHIQQNYLPKMEKRIPRLEQTQRKVLLNRYQFCLQRNNQIL